VPQLWRRQCGRSRANGLPPAEGICPAGPARPVPDGPPVVWGDPTTLVLEVEVQTPIRHQRILEVDTDERGQSASKRGYGRTTKKPEQAASDRRRSSRKEAREWSRRRRNQAGRLVATISTHLAASRCCQTSGTKALAGYMYLYLPSSQQGRPLGPVRPAAKRVRAGQESYAQRE
jgi:hypothetical protein